MKKTRMFDEARGFSCWECESSYHSRNHTNRAEFLRLYDKGKYGWVFRCGHINLGYE